jgi:hypothetical protein
MASNSENNGLDGVAEITRLADQSRWVPSEEEFWAGRAINRATIRQAANQFAQSLHLDVHLRSLTESGTLEKHLADLIALYWSHAFTVGAMYLDEHPERG